MTSSTNAADWLFKVERPQIEPWDFEQHARLLQSAMIEAADWYAAVCLAGEAGLRSEQVSGVNWEREVRRRIGDGSTRHHGRRPAE
jgi:hypothetical protein